MAEAAYYRDIREKRDILRREYGGMMMLKDLARELGYKDYHSARNAVAVMGIPATRVGGSIRFETDLVAKALVDARGTA